MNKSAWLRTLMLSGLAGGVQKIAEPFAGTGDLAGIAAMSGAVVASVVGGYLVNRGTSEHEGVRSGEELKALAARNHHLRRGMAAALRRALESASGVRKDLAEEWVRMLKQAEADNDALDRLFPVEFAEDHWSATNAYSRNVDEDERALAGCSGQVKSS